MRREFTATAADYCLLQPEDKAAVGHRTVWGLHDIFNVSNHDPRLSDCNARVATRFAVDVVALIEAGKGATAASYLLVNNCGGIVAALLPVIVHRRLKPALRSK